jgi:CheY-specific phosphatase CheX
MPSLDLFFDFLLHLEQQAGLIQKKDILNAYFELFECAPEEYLRELFNMMEAKLFSHYHHSGQVVDEESKIMNNGNQHKPSTNLKPLLSPQTL